MAGGLDQEERKSHDYKCSRLSLASQSSSELDVLGLDGDSLSVDGLQDG
jgi:hypothetical protein